MPDPTTYQFGLFEVRVASGELLKQGKRIKLQDQPFRLLVFLLENSGQVIMREEIQRRLWPDNTFVDFDSGLRVAVGKLREALEDDAEHPRYIETIPKRGYRFVVPAIRLGDRSTARSLVVSAPEESPPPAATAPACLSPHTSSARTVLSPSSRWIVSAVLLTILIAAATFLFFARAPRKLTSADTVVLADFANSTGDPVFDGTLRRGLAVQLDQSPFLSLISDQRIQGALGLMGRSTDTLLSPEIAREICERAGGAVVLDGSIASLGNQYVLGLRARDCRTGDVLDEEQVQAAKKEDVLKALDQIASRFRSRLGESLTTIQEHHTPLAEATTRSLEALKAFSTAEQLHFTVDPEATLALYQRAIEIDPKFAMAYAGLAHVYGEAGESDLSAEAASKAYELRDRASDLEKFFITLSYQLRVTGDLEKSIQTCEVWAQTYPRDVRPHTFLTAMLQMIGQHPRSIDEGKRAVELDPDFDVAYTDLAAGYQNLGRFDEAHDTLRRAVQRNLQFPDYAIQRYQLAFLKGDRAAMDREAAQGESMSQASIYQNEALALAYSGQLSRANEKSRRASVLAQQAGQRESAALFDAGAALWNAFFRDVSAARRWANEALKLSHDREVEYGAAFALALAGEPSKSRSVADDLERRFPDDTSVQLNYLPSLRALLAVKAGEPSQALALLDAARSSELGTPRATIHGYFGALYPVYVRGEAYLAAQQPANAAAEFQKILDHRGIVVSDPIGALAHLQIGTAYLMARDKARAESSLHDFLDLWKDADSDIPLLKEAKAEYTNVQ